MITIHNLTHHHGVRPVLKNVNLTIAKGEVVALMGPNGMGKSTLMAAVVGILHPLKGHVEINGLIRRSSPENELAIRKQVAFLPAETWTPGARTGREWMLAVGRLYVVEDDHLMRHVDALLKLFDLHKQAD